MTSCFCFHDVLLLAACHADDVVVLFVLALVLFPPSSEASPDLMVSGDKRAVPQAPQPASFLNADARHVTVPDQNQVQGRDVQLRSRLGLEARGPQRDPMAGKGRAELEILVCLDLRTSGQTCQGDFFNVRRRICMLIYKLWCKCV